MANNNRWLAWSGALTVAGLLVIQLAGRMRFERALTGAEARGDTIRAVLRQREMLRRAALVAGDSLPDLRLVSGRGDTIPLRGLPGLGYSFIYAYRSDCSACALIAPAVRQVEAKVPGRIAYVAYDPRGLATAEPLPDHFLWVPTTLISDTMAFEYVPAFGRIQRDGRIAVIAHGIPSVAKLWDLENLLSRRVVDSMVRANSRPGDSAASTPAVDDRSAARGSATLSRSGL